MSCKKCAFIYLRHNDLQDLNSKYGVRSVQGHRIDPKLTPLSGEELQGRTSNNSN